MIEKDQLTPCQFVPGFFKVPGLPFSANENGLVYSYRLQCIPKAFFDPKKIQFNKYIHVEKTLAHRLVAMTFLKLPEGRSFSELVVNHKNGLKYDNRATNLEWTNYSGNATHAYETGLRDDNRIVKTLNVLTSEELVFYSLWDCARFFGINGARVHGYLTRKARKVLFLEKYLLVDFNEDFPPKEEWVTWKLSVTEIEYCAFDIKTNKLFIFSRRKEAFRHAGIPDARERRLIGIAEKEQKDFVRFDDWVFVPLSLFRENHSSIEDNRVSREKRYANYRPRNCKSGLLTGNGQVKST